MGKNGKRGYSTKVFFLEGGKYKIDLPKDFNNVELNIDSLPTENIRFYKNHWNRFI